MKEVKIKKVDVKNLKAVSNFTAFFDGKSAHITGKNGAGKSTVIRALTDRLRGLKPEVVTKIGETDGQTILELTDGAKFVWDYNKQGQDKLSYYSNANNYKPDRREVFKSIVDNYFPSLFDINKFLTTTEPAKRLKMISELINVDLSEVQSRYKNAFDIRRDAKKALKLLEDQIFPRPEKEVFENDDFSIEKGLLADIEAAIKKRKDEISKEKDRLNSLYRENKQKNDASQAENDAAYQKSLDEWLEVEEEREQMIIKFNDIQVGIGEDIEVKKGELFEITNSLSGTVFNDLFDFGKANELIYEMPEPKPLMVFVPTERPGKKVIELPDPMPDSSSLRELESDLLTLESSLDEVKETLSEKESLASEANAAKQVYELKVKQYNEHQAKIKELFDEVQECEIDVAEILSEIKGIIRSAKLPDEFTIDLTNKNDILFRVDENSEYLPITVETLASSAIFIAAFKLQASYLTAFKVAHFDVSYLDFENRKKVFDEAICMGIQLITESPAMTEGEMELQCIITED